MHDAASNSIYSQRVRLKHVSITETREAAQERKARVQDGKLALIVMLIGWVSRDSPAVLQSALGTEAREWVIVAGLRTCGMLARTARRADSRGRVGYLEFWNMQEGTPDCSVGTALIGTSYFPNAAVLLLASPGRSGEWLNL